MRVAGPRDAVSVDSIKEVFTTSRQHTGHELSRARVHEGERAQQDHDKGGHQTGHGKLPGPVDVQKALRGMDYPASKAAIVECAERSHAVPDVLDRLTRIPDREYDTPASVSKALVRLM